MQFLIILCAKYLIAVSAVLLVWCIYATRGDKRKKLLILAAVSLPLTYAVGYIAGHIFYNARPFVVGHFLPLIEHAPDNGFPSDHMLLAAALAMVGYFLSRRLGGILWILAILIGISRIAAGVHHTLDIVGSSVIAMAVVSSIDYILAKRILKKSSW